MAEIRIAKPYAKSLFELAEEAGSLDAVHQDLKDIADTIKGSEDLEAFLHNPVIPEEKAEQVLKDLVLVS